MSKHSENQPAKLQCKRSKLKEPVQSANSWNRAIENSSEDHLYREIGDAERITAAHIIVKGYKMHAKMKYRIKNGKETENYEIAGKRFENTFRAIGFGFRGRGTPEGLLKACTNLSPH